ncbi:MAG TPA: demethoxyubiquinone hydroxylase family protein [Rhizomicrobium sp.]|jgi:ubiquinone biosynthesis monooxygenase Coq7|nr:demethoxyubiquinone hydroxylase family protein [Rhizomicrobium sp.]
MPRKPKPPAPGAQPDIEAMIRVDHAGEYGAVRIYEGQLAVLKRRKGAGASVETIQHMADQEQRHLKTFDRLVNERRVRPTALEPVWRVAGFALGAATAAMGEKVAFACTAAVEEAIDEHYAQQIEALAGKDPALKFVVKEFRADEAQHRDTALRHGAEQTPGYKLLSETIKAGCRIAIKLSERI